ncbi:MAG: hypothetical protein GXP29_08045 [Planctomycetes bacterium]|nr:hypothetical protein [Planctomycetota bacterium]
MSRGDNVTVYRGGFLSSLVYGICGVVGVAVVGAVVLGVYGLNVVDRKIDKALLTGGQVIHSLPEIRKALPPILADALNDRRSPEYRDQLAITAKVLPSSDDRKAAIVIEATNNGPEMVTLLAVRVNLEDRSGRFVRSERAYIATPMLVEGEWDGPILSGATRRHMVRVWQDLPDVLAQVEICDIRVWESKATDTDRDG